MTVKEFLSAYSDAGEKATYSIVDRQKTKDFLVKPQSIYKLCGEYEFAKVTAWRAIGRNQIFIFVN